MKTKIILTSTLLIILSVTAAAQLEFRSESSLEYYASQDLNNNDIINPAQFLTGGSGSDNITIRDSSNNLDIARFMEGGNVQIPEGNLQISGGVKLPGFLEISNTGTIKSLKDNGNLVLDLGSGGKLRVLDSSDNNIFSVKDSGNVSITSGDLNLNGNALTNLAAPVNSNDAVRLQYVESQFVDRYGDTLNGSLNFNGYDITRVDMLNWTSGLKIEENVNLNGGSVTTSTGEVCIGDQCS